MNPQSTTLDVQAINNLISGKQAIKVGIDLQSALILIVGVFLAVVLAVIIAKVVSSKIS